MARFGLPPSQYHFPDPQKVDPMGDGLIASGADLSPSTIVAAYERGLFPWFSQGDPIYWWSPDPRCVIYPAQFVPSKSLQRNLKKNQYTLTLDRDFNAVIRACAEARAYADSTWISEDIIQGYSGLHQAGLAHSIEVWQQDELVGGLYGVQLGQGFFGESMFSRRSDVSKMAFYFLMQLCAGSGFRWVDCQLPNDHLLSLGATTLPRAKFLADLKHVLRLSPPDWTPLQNRPIASADLLTDAAFSGLIKPSALFEIGEADDRIHHE